MKGIDIFLNDKIFHGTKSEPELIVEIPVTSEDDREFFRQWLWERNCFPKEDIIRSVTFKNLGFFKDDGVLFGCQPLDPTEDDKICIVFDSYQYVPKSV